MRIVLADDHELIRDGLRALLENGGMDIVGEAANGQEAVELSVKFRPQLVILDVSMPVMNGIQAAVQIRQLSADTKIIMLSMHDSDEMKQVAKDSGVDAYVTKSSAAQRLLKTIAEVCVPDVSTARMET
jgi:DNA-binding NarL/FixJ family response regulator